MRSLSRTKRCRKCGWESILSIAKRAQGLSTELQTGDASYQTPMFWAPTPALGPARLSLAPFSGRVLRIEQAPAE